MGLNFDIDALGVVRIDTPYLFYCYRSFGPYVNRLVDRREAALGEHGADVDRAVVQSDTSREGPGPLLTEPIDACLEPGEHGAPEAFEGEAAAARQRCGSDLAGFMSDRARISAKAGLKSMPSVCLTSCDLQAERLKVVEAGAKEITLCFYHFPKNPQTASREVTARALARDIDHAQQLGPA